jgi:hypothetical protein
MQQNDIAVVVIIVNRQDVEILHPSAQPSVLRHVWVDISAG